MNKRDTLLDEHISKTIPRNYPSWAYLFFGVYIIQWFDLHHSTYTVSDN